MIKCLINVDEMKQSGKIIESIKTGKKLRNFIFTLTRDKCPAILIQTIEDNLIKQINNSNEIITVAKKNVNCHK